MLIEYIAESLAGTFRHPITIDRENNLAYLHLNSDEYSPLVATIDLNDLAKVEPYRWYDVTAHGKASAHTSVHDISMSLGRFLMDCRKGDGLKVSYRDQNPLNCRRSNLIVLGTLVLTDKSWANEPQRLLLIEKRDRLLARVAKIDQQLFNLHDK